MFQQNYPSVQHPYTFELNKDFNFLRRIIYQVKMQANACAHGHTYFVNLTIVGDSLDHNGF